MGGSWIRWLRRKRRTRPFILMYHRVGEPLIDPWGLSVSRENFRSQMALLKTERTPLSMDDFARRLRSGSLPADAVAVTFDDGYVDNLSNAKPILEEHAIPATIFLSTGHIDHAAEYWWDELARLVLLSEGPWDFTIRIGAIDFPFRALGAPAIRPHWRAEEPAHNEREELYVAAWTALQPLSADSRTSILAQLRSRIGQGAPPVSASDLPMSSTQVRELVEGGNLSIGAHTVSHPMLTRLSASERQAEIHQSKSDCERMVGAPVSGFAYPYGDRSGDVEAEVREAGFAWACSTRSDFVSPGRDGEMELPRLAAPDLDAAAFAARLFFR